MINLTDLEKKINSELTTKIKKSEIKDYPFHKANHKIFSLFKYDYWTI